jgi:HemY protein
MIRIVIIIITALLLATLIWFVGNNDGKIIVDWLDYHVEASFTFTISAILLLIFIAQSVFKFIIWIKNIPTRMSHAYKEYRSKAGMLALIDGFGALTAGDVALAKKMSKKLIKNSEDENLKLMQPLTDLFQSQVAIISDQNADAEKYFLSMLEHEKTKFIGLKGLVKLKMKQQNYAQALEHAKAAYAIFPKAAWLLSSLIELYIRDKDWDLAEKMTKKAMDFDFLTKKEAIGKIIEILYMHADELDKELNKKDLQKNLERILKFDQSEVKAATRLVKIFINEDKQRAAFRIIEKAWACNQSSELINTVPLIYASAKPEKLLDKLNELVDKKPGSFVGNITLIKTMIKQNLLEQAKTKLDKLIEIHGEHPDLCILMANLESKYGSRHNIISKWLEKN